ncbi:F-box associated domain [Macleaya cordata]|uniref:F-box associated domain n=1 Tax=Macleaya cordata TaxID=56857 RepID=A0A200QL41_MACCD|nr:F-box associated domain [Macleaya cordata]
MEEMHKAIADDVLGGLRAGFYLLNHCNGLLFFLSYGGPFLLDWYFIYNPLIQEVAKLPETIRPRIRTLCFLHLGLGFSPSTREYKIVGVNNINARIHTLGTTSWRHVLNYPLNHIEGEPVYADGALHWKIGATFYASANTTNMEYRFVSFDIGNEEFSITRHPNLSSKRNHLIDLIEFRGCLAVVDLSLSTHIEIWVMKNINMRGKQWNRDYCIKIQAPDGK